MTEQEPSLADPDGSAPLRRRHFVDLSPLRESPAFARLWIGGAISGIGGQMTIVAVGLHIYDLTQSTLAVALVALFALGPMIVFGLYGGVLADSFDRRTVALVTAIIAWASTAGIAALSWLNVDVVWPLYVLSTVNAVASTVIGSTRQAITPRLLPTRLLPAASALTGISMGVMVTVGPALAGLLVASVGFSWTYTIDVVMFLAAFLGIFTLPRIVPEGERQKAGLESVLFGLRFLKTAPNIRMTFLLDIIAMTFGQPRALFPAVGALLIGGGAVSVGILTAAAAVGTLVSSIFSGRLGHVRQQGRAISQAIIVYGACILGFGIVLGVVALNTAGPAGQSFDQVDMVALVAASLLLAGSGAADNVSAIFRMTILQSSVPDGMRGRLQGIFTVVVAGGPRLGDLYVGVLAVAGALWFPPLVGGLVIMVAVGVIVRMQRTFTRYDALDPTP
ncbi:MFS transporter [Compostimonas suwonensis]|uniref:Putative MFS family arabinose efflux permease n=1 Tax=Compostimonas suwonensis TaxID=1048394 RepID=A0A2M9BYS6_9MICO|nr:MFS transporter [Compostimonas suwonensis]PJJ63232.1 putative MFS family arabinose efflux permease [Compostimonas suwonensis]